METPTASIHNIHFRRRLENGTIQETLLQLTTEPSSCPLTSEDVTETEGSVIESPRSVPPAQPFEKEIRKVVKTDRTIILRRTGNKLAGTFRIANISMPGQPVLFKITYTHAQIFAVRPIIGLIYPNKQGTIMVFDGPPEIPEAELEKIKFRVDALPITFDQIQDSRSNETARENLHELKRIWSKKVSESQFQPQIENLNVVIEHLAPAPKVVQNTCRKDDDDNEAKWFPVIWFGFVFMIFLSIFIYSNLTMEPELPPPPQKPTVDKAKCFGGPI